MKDRMESKQQLLSLADAAMAICWTYAWAAFLLSVAFGYHLSFSAAALVYGIGAVVAVFGGRFFKRPITLIASRLIALVVLLAGLTRSMPLEGWLFLLLYAASVTVIYARGITNVQKPMTADNVYARFDLGLAAFSLLLLVKIIAVSKGATVPDYPGLPSLFFPFFGISLLAMAMSRHSKESAVKTSPRLQKLILVTLFSVIVLLSATLAMRSFQTQMNTGAKVISEVFVSTAKSMEKPLQSIIRFVLMHRRSPRPLAPDQPPSGVEPAADDNSKPSWWFQALVFVMAAVLLALAIGGLIVLLRHLIRYLFRKKTDPEPLTGHFFGGRALQRWIRDAYRALRAIIIRWCKGHGSAIELYAALKRWGRRSGVKRHTTETPFEYGQRLTQFFPDFEKEICAIIDLVHTEVFRQTALPRNRLQDGIRAWHRLRAPRHWPKRLRSYFSYDRS